MLGASSSSPSIFAPTPRDHHETYEDRARRLENAVVSGALYQSLALALRRLQTRPAPTRSAREFALRRREEGDGSGVHAREGKLDLLPPLK